jgi:metal-responsive CopG/Arc/MetJ family transcriptional regulator
MKSPATERDKILMGAEVPRGLARAFDAEAKRQRRTRSQLMRLVLEDYVDKRRDERRVEK